MKLENIIPSFFTIMTESIRASPVSSHCEGSVLEHRGNGSFNNVSTQPPVKPAYSEYVLQSKRPLEQHKLGTR